MKVAVGSKNPVKIQAVKLAFEKVFPNQKWEFEGTDVSSGVRAQPMSDEESITGARNRASNALLEFKADYGVGLEGGLQEIAGEWYDCGWAVVINKKGDEGIGSSIRMHTPEKIMKYIHDGKELGEVTDILFDKINSKQQQGHFGLMTNNAITREAGYRDGVISALVRFLHPDIY